MLKICEKKKKKKKNVRDIVDVEKVGVNVREFKIEIAN